MMAVRYHGCTCHLRYSNANNKDGNYSPINNANGKANNNSNSNNVSSKDLAAEAKDGKDDLDEAGKGEEEEEVKPQPWYFHVVASFILVVHGLTFLVPHDPDSEDTDMMRIVGKWFGFDWDWMKVFTPYAQGLAAVFNISLGIVSWWTSKESERYNRLIQLRVFVFCVNILHAYITGPIIYQSDDTPLLAPGRIIGLFRLSYLTPGLMAAGVTEVIVEKEHEGGDKKNDSNNKIEDNSSASGKKESTPSRSSHSKKSK